MMRTVKNVLVIHFDLEKLRKKRVQHLYMSPILLLTETYTHYHSLTYKRNPQDVINIDKKTLNLSTLYSPLCYWHSRSFILLIPFPILPSPLQLTKPPNPHPLLTHRLIPTKLELS